MDPDKDSCVRSRVVVLLQPEPAIFSVHPGFDRV